MKRFLVLLPLILVWQGCVTEQMIADQLAKCSPYVQQNVGEIKYMPVSWGTVMLISGVTDIHTGEIWLSAWANEHTILHEIAHSVYFRVPHEEFDRRFKQADGWISPWAIGHREAVAEAFVAGMKGRSNERIDCAMDFFRGPAYTKKRSTVRIENSLVLPTALPDYP